MLGEVGADSMPRVVAPGLWRVSTGVEDGVQQVKDGGGGWRRVGRFDWGERGGSGGGDGAEDDRRAAWCRACAAVVWCGRSAETVVVGALSGVVQNGVGGEDVLEPGVFGRGVVAIGGDAGIGVVAAKQGAVCVGDLRVGGVGVDPEDGVVVVVVGAGHRRRSGCERAGGAATGSSPAAPPLHVSV